MNKYLSILTVLFTAACAASDDLPYEGVGDGGDLGQAEQDISVRPYYGVERHLNMGEECVTASFAKCHYPSSKTIGIRLETNGLVSTEATMAQAVLTETIAQVRSQLPAGWSVTQLFGAPSSVANLVINFTNQGTWDTTTGPLQTWMLGLTECTSEGFPLVEFIQGEHRLCHRRVGRVNIQQILFMNAAQRANLFEHIFGAFILAAAGRGT
jgi:hypothetical protein